jgi:hypothetical protein
MAKVRTNISVRIWNPPRLVFVGVEFNSGSLVGPN